MTSVFETVPISVGCLRRSFPGELVIDFGISGYGTALFLVHS